MGIRRASAYSKKKLRPYTRKSSRKAKAYVKAVPPLKIVKYNMGDRKSFDTGKHNYVVRMISTEKVQMRDMSLEASRMFIHKDMDRLAPGQYYFVVKVYPHHILRENKAAGGTAGADRLSHGMKHSFGVTVGRAAIITPGKEVFFISCTDEKTARFARDTLTKIKAKIPFRNQIIFEKIR